MIMRRRDHTGGLGGAIYLPYPEHIKQNCIAFSMTGCFLSCLCQLPGRKRDEEAYLLSKDVHVHRLVLHQNMLGKRGVLL